MMSVFVIGCSQQKFVVAPPFTDMSRINTLKEGMSKEEVVSALQIQPFDLYFVEAKNEVYVFNYRLKERRIPVTNRSTYVEQGTEMLNENMNSEVSQREGVTFYTEWRKLYVSFKDGKMISAITDSGREDGNNLVILKKAIEDSQKSDNIKVVPNAILEENTVIPTQDGNYITPNCCTTQSTVPASSVIVQPAKAEIATVPKKPAEGKTGMSIIKNKKGKK